MTDPNVAETTDEYGRRVTIGPDGNKTTELAEFTVEGDPNELKREQDLANQATLEQGRLDYQAKHPSDELSGFPTTEVRQEVEKEIGHKILGSAGETLTGLGETATGEALGGVAGTLGLEALFADFAAQTLGVTADPSSPDFGPRATCPGICPTCPDELQQNTENHCTLGAGHLDQNFSSGHICDRGHSWM